MKKILLVGMLFSLNSLLCMRPRSGSFNITQRSKSEVLEKKKSAIVEKRQRSYSFSGIEKRQKSPSLTRKKRSLSSSKPKESFVVQAVRRAFINKQMTDDDVRQIKSYLAFYEHSKEVKHEEEKVPFLDVEAIKDIDEKDNDGCTLLYKAIEDANKEIKESKKLSKESESKLCFLLFNGANQYEPCGTDKLKSPRDIASPKIKQLLKDWNVPWSPRKEEMLNQGLQYLEISKK